MGTDGSVSDGVETVLGGESREGDIRRLSYMDIIFVDGAAVVAIVVAVAVMGLGLTEAGADTGAWGLLVVGVGSVCSSSSTWRLSKSHMTPCLEQFPQRGWTSSHLILRFLHRRQPARDFLCDRLGGIRRVEIAVLMSLNRCSKGSRCATHWWHCHAGRGIDGLWSLDGV